MYWEPTYLLGGSSHALPYTLVRALLQLTRLTIRLSFPPACSEMLPHKRYYNYNFHYENHSILTEHSNIYIYYLSILHIISEKQYYTKND